MQARPPRALHPLLTVAAISITVFSAVGVAALTGLVPTSSGSGGSEAPALASTVQPKAVPAPVVAAPAPKPRPVVRQRPVARPKPAPVVGREFAEAPHIVEAPNTVVQPGVLGMVESVREVKEPGEAKGLGVIAGGVAGAVLGHQVGNGRGNKLATVLGAAGGALAGNHIERQARRTTRWDITVRLDDGSSQTLSSEAQPFWSAGDRVRLHEGKLLPV